MISFKKIYTVEQLEYILLNRLTKDYDISQTVISDKDKLFISNYWKTLITLIETKQKMSTLFHSETDKINKSDNENISTALY